MIYPHTSWLLSKPCVPEAIREPSNGCGKIYVRGTTGHTRLVYVSKPLDPKTKKYTLSIKIIEAHPPVGVDIFRKFKAFKRLFDGSHRLFPQITDVRQKTYPVIPKSRGLLKGTVEDLDPIWKVLQQVVKEFRSVGVKYKLALPKDDDQSRNCHWFMSFLLDILGDKQHDFPGRRHQSYYGNPKNYASQLQAIQQNAKTSLNKTALGTLLSDRKTNIGFTPISQAQHFNQLKQKTTFLRSLLSFGFITGPIQMGLLYMFHHNRSK